MTSIPDLSLQLYSVREELIEDFPGTLARLADIGLSRVEPFDLVTHADDLGRSLITLGLSAPTAHQALDGADLDRIFDVAADLGVSNVFHPFTPAERCGTKPISRHWVGANWTSHRSSPPRSDSRFPS
jgi:hypothetical protein